jgi:2TM domain
MANEQFNADQAEAILMRAVNRKIDSTPGITREQISAMAAELDIPQEDVDAAIAESQRETQDIELRKRFVAGRRITLLPHTISFVSVNLILFAIWWHFGGGYPWFLYSLFGWGSGFATHVALVYPAGGSVFETAFAQYRALYAASSPAVVRKTAMRMAKSTASQGDVPVVAEPVFEAQPVTEQPKVVLQAGR